ncbi:glycosyl hydrolase family 18 protein [Streptomyces physcomitrii]|uniref:chitinase n=1 Tax=Streptomyces physcomitrii TaxID=2724184 RepID=A0ABX1GXZ4_9ACTN|nr:glycosyl hydrolase family 18 protein [Streptomyces physcomitrii]NKI40971.1 chitinase [Streptomyces physcomitrii]
MQRRRILSGLGAALTASALAGFTLGPAQAATGSPAAKADSPHVLAYYQTQYQDGSYVSPLPLKGIATDVEVAAFHLNGDGSIHLNDDPPSDAKFDQVWKDVAELRSSGTKVHALLGGAAQGTYANLAADFERYYKPLHDTVEKYGLDGVDLDIEETFSLENTKKLIERLRTDFGTDFSVILTPVATDLAGTSNFSGGFDYAQLEREAGSQISFYTGQFYCGWGDLGGTGSYDNVIGNGFSPSRVVAGALTNPANCQGYVEPGTLASTLTALKDKHQGFGGVAGWEYFNAVEVDGTGPATWYAHVRKAAGG